MRISAEDKIYNELQRLCRNGTMATTSDIADSLGISRNAVSHHLNRLMEKGLIEKSGAKPVYWNITAEQGSRDAFEGFIGYNGSLTEAVEQCKAAVNYPPNGLPVMINGPSGAGKSNFARTIYQYALDTGAVNREAPFITLNCADYADNPQLLSSMLFGYRKGAFTGADTDRTGLIHEADGGYLFLDEVHRLSNENQEKLFILMDQGKYRPVGDSKNWISVDVRLIFATTENITQTLLPTFRRRITVHVYLSSFISRPLDERVAIIADLYHFEARTVRRDIFVTPMVLNNICFLDMEGNIGTLINIVKLSCASAFNRISGEGRLVITESDLPYEGLYRGGEKINAITSGLEITQDVSYKENLQAMPVAFTGAERFWVEIKAFEEGASLVHLKNEYNNIKEQIEKSDVFTSITTGRIPAEIFRNVAGKVLYKYGLSLPEKDLDTCYGWYFYCIRKSRRSLPDNMEFLLYLKRKYPRTYYISEGLVHAFEESMSEGLMEPEILKTLLFFALYGLVEEDLLFHGLVIAHGQGIASGIATIANHICGSFLFESFDMPLGTYVDDIIEKVNHYISVAELKNGLILLVDMGSLNEMYVSIKKVFKGDLLIVDNVTSLLAIDIGMKIRGNATFGRITESVGSGFAPKCQYFEGVGDSGNVIITSISGNTIAEKIKEIIEKYISSNVLEIKILEYGAMKNMLRTGIGENLKNAKMVISTFDFSTYNSGLIENYSVPLLYLPNLWNEDGSDLLWRVLNPYMEYGAYKKLKEDLLKFFSIEGVGNRLNFLNPAVIINEVELVIGRYERYYDKNFESFKKLNLYLHISAMIERLMLRTEICERDIKAEKTAEIMDFFDTSNRFFTEIIKKYNIDLNEFELLLLYDLIMY